MSDHDHLMDLFQRYEAALQSGDSGACAACYAEDAEYVASAMAPVRGRAAIRDLHDALFLVGVKKWSLHVRSITVSGWMAYSRQAVLSDGTGSDVMLVAVKGTDGVWLIQAEAEIPRR
ncbi:YybH family protein [Roseovarius indicus]|uniref:YybH family protein n=1 Tax=Roseovarius indicus TaxID=540747 RepID=UPI0007D98A4F|nr:SgcJ/EcaC family oxidoreductase [Roseovarius indicus]OAO06935.1 hypothetical protein A8B76_13355 [Roseovarius indicus]